MRTRDDPGREATRVIVAPVRLLEPMLTSAERFSAGCGTCLVCSGGGYKPQETERRLPEVVLGTVS